jgi:hypothetical protein
MKPLRWTLGLLLILAVGVLTAEEQKDAGFVPLFNGRDLTGWVNVNCAPGTFLVKDGEIITTGKPTGFLRTEKQYENFVLELEWMHVNKKEVGNSGVFLWGDPLPAVGTPFTRGIEVQVLVNLEKPNAYTSHGDVFSIQGATCKPDRPHPMGWARCLPSERRAKGGGEWNHYRIEAKDGAIKLHVNGKEVSGVSECKPRKGYLALESEGAECHFRNIKIKELPTNNPKPDEVADVAKGFTNLFFGDLTGWKADAGVKKHWQAKDWVLLYDGAGQADEKVLRTEKEFGNVVYRVDFRFPAKKAAPCSFAVRDGKDEVIVTLAPSGKFRVTGPGGNVEGEFTGLKPAGQWNRLQLGRGGKYFDATVNDKLLAKTTGGAAGTGTFSLRPEGEMSFANLFVMPLGVYGDD